VALQGRARRAPSPLVRDARLIALHEAGHAVAAHALGLVVTRVTIEPTYDTFYQKWRLGVTEIEVIGDLTRDFSFAMRDRLHREAIFSLAGPAAERRAFGQVALDADDTDEEVARWLLSRDTPTRDLPEVLRAAKESAATLVIERESAIARLAAVLMLHRTLTGAQLCKRRRAYL